MDIQEMLKSMIGLFLLTTPADTDTTGCGVFNFKSPNIFDGVLVVKEGERVNITFSWLHRNCSKHDSVIDISIKKTYENLSVSEILCTIQPTCHDRPAFSNVSCSCLETPGFYTLTFIAVRKHSTTWTFSVVNADVPNNSVTLNVIYPPNLSRLEIVGYDSYIPQHQFVTVVCSWENGNPPSTVKLLDRHNTSLEKGDKTGNISYTFSPAECNHAGVIRCEAGESDRNLSTTMLIECPPEFVQNASIINKVTIGRNDNITFHFRSHTSIISSCIINLLTQDRKADTNQFVLKCPKVVENTTTVIHENKHCLYSVTGEPPDLLLVIHVRQLTRQESGFWHVTVSNYKGSGEIYRRVTVKDGSDPMDIRGRNSKADVIIGVISAAAIILIIVYMITKGTEAYRRQGSLKQEHVLQETIGTDEIAKDTVEQIPRQSQMYYEIPDLLESETKAQQFTMIKNDLYSPS